MISALALLIVKLRRSYHHRILRLQLSSPKEWLSPVCSEDGADPERKCYISEKEVTEEIHSKPCKSSVAETFWRGSRSSWCKSA